MDTGRATVVTEIRAVNGVVPLGLQELWAYRDLLGFFIWRDIKGRYKQTALGPLWIILQPIFNMIIFSLIFGVVAKLPSDGIPYPVFNYTAMLPWLLFANATAGAAGSLVGQKQLISKVYFPRLIAPLTAVASGLIDFLIQFVILLGMVLYYGFDPSWRMLMIPVYLILAMSTALAVGLWTAGWVAQFWDVATLLGYLTRVWMYATPVVYASSLIPAKWQTLYHLNPMTSVVEGFRWAVLGVGAAPDRMLVFSFALVLPLLISGAYVFRMSERNIVDTA